MIYCLLLWLPGLFSIPATDRDESRFAQATKQMLETGDFVDIRNGTEARNRKPIGIYWLQAPGAALARAIGFARSNPIWPYRLPSLAGGLVAVLATFAIGRKMAGTPVGLLAAAMLGGCVLLTTETNIAKTDAALLGATTLAMGVLARAYLRFPVGVGAAAMFWVAVGSGILVKGPLTPMVAGLTALTLVISDRRGRWLGVLRPLWGVPLMLAVVVPWFIAIGVATHGQFFHDAVGGDLGSKLTSGDDAHGAPPGYHLLLLSLTLFPSAPMVFCALPAAWANRREPGTRFLIAWIVPSWLVFEAVPTKLPHYPLPVFPALCLLAASWLCSPARRDAPRWLSWLATILFVLAAASLGLAGAALPIVLTRGLTPFALIGLPTLLAATLLAWRVLREPDRIRATLIGLALLPVLIWCFFGFEVPSAWPLWIAPRVQAALEHHAAPTGFAAVGYAEPSLMFICGTDTKLLSGGALGAHFLANGAGRVVLVEGRNVKDFEATATVLGLKPHAFASLDGFNYSNGRHVTLTLYDAP